MKFTIALAALLLAGLSFASTAVELPKKVTPALRAACEKDVRRLCIRSGSTIQSVKACVRRNFRKLNTRCQIKLVQAGL